jgi:hypothetical protein
VRSGYLEENNGNYLVNVTRWGRGNRMPSTLLITFHSCRHSGFTSTLGVLEAIPGRPDKEKLIIKSTAAQSAGSDPLQAKIQSGK